MSEDTLSDPPPIPAPVPAEASRPGLEDPDAAEETARRRPRPRGGRGRKGGLGFGDAEGDEPAVDETSAAEATDTLMPPGPGDAPATSEAPDAGVTPRPPQPRPPRDPRDPRRDARSPRPDPRPSRPDPRDQRREPRPPRPEYREPRHEPRPPRPERPDRTVLDPNEVSDMAWQLFFGELREEGLALVDDADGEKLTNRCFKLAEIFLRTRQRRLNQLFVGGTTVNDERQREEPRGPLPPKPTPPIPIEKRLPDDPSRLSKTEAEALIDEAQEAAEAQPEAASVGSESVVAVTEASPRSSTAAPDPTLPTEPPSPDDGGD